jgi:hypothetical protein
MRPQCIPHDLSRSKFGRLTPQRIISYKPVVWECLCDCGNIAKVTANALVQENTKSCGCLRSENSGNLTRKRPYESLYNAFKASSEKVKRKVYISYNEFLTLTSITNCHYCDVPIVWTKFAIGLHGNRSAYYLDRKDNTQCYTLDNVVVCCTRCNKGKSDQFTYEEWVEIGKCIRRMREKSDIDASFAAMAQDKTYQEVALSLYNLFEANKQ